MGGIEAGIKGADLHVFTGDTGRVGLIGLHPAQAPVALKLGAAPTGGIAEGAGVQPGRGGLFRACANQKQQHADRGRFDAYVHVEHSLFCFCVGSAVLPSPRPLAKRLVHPSQILLAQGARVVMQLGPGHQVVVAGLGQVSAGSEQLLFGVQRIEVDPLTAQDALLGRHHQRFRRSQGFLIGPQLAHPRQTGAELPT
ncbi:hypothetical protein D3C75_806830 [compost metagenome]